MEISEFTPDTATDADLRGYWAVVLARQETDEPDEQPASFDTAVGRLRNPPVGFGPVRYWVARGGGELVGYLVVYFPGHENRRLALVDTTVHPRHRRRGIGTALLRAALPTLRAQRRTVVQGWQLPRGGDGERWALGVGMRVAWSSIIQRLVIADADPALWEVPVPEGYALREWVAAAPDDLIDSYAAARAVMAEAPVGDLSYDSHTWSAARQREHEAELRDGGVEQRAVVAVRDGEVVGLTVVEIHPHRPTWAFQRDTGVMRGHRGHGLGRAMKARLIRGLVAARPGFEQCHTATGADNVHMARVNHQLGFRTVRQTVAVSGESDALRVSPSRGCPA